MEDQNLNENTENQTDKKIQSSYSDIDKRRPNKRKKKTFIQKWNELIKEKRSFKMRLLLAFLSSLAFTYTLFIFGPFEIYIKNMNYYTFSFEDLLLQTLLIGMGIIIVLTLILTILRGKIFTWCVTAVFSTTICAYIQGNWIKYNLGSLDGHSIKWEDLTLNMVLNLIIWAVIFLIPYIVAYFKLKIWRNMVSFVSILLVLMQTVGLVSLLMKNDFVDVVANGYLSNSTIYEVSPKKNVIVFLLDRFDHSMCKQVFDRYPDIEESLTGFVSYDNAIGSYSRTFPSVTYLLTGVKCNYDMPMGEYFKKAWQESTFLKDIREAGYESKIYTEVNYVIRNVKNAKDQIDNIGEHLKKVNISKMMSAMYELSAYRYTPLAMKPFFWCYTGDLENVTSVDENTYVPDIYSTNDAEFYSNLLSKGLSVNEENKGSFIFYHLRATHDPYVMDADGSTPAGGTDAYRQTAGNLYMILNYIQMLKEKNLYDDTTIIITADHGYTGTLEELESKRSITLMVKPSGADTNLPMSHNEAPITHDNIRSTILKIFGINYDESIPAIEDVPENTQITRYFYMSGSNSIKTKRDYNLVTYAINGDCKDFSNWSIVSKERIEYPFYDANN